MSETNGTRGMKLLTGNSNRELADKMAAYLKLPFTKAAVRRFADMEVFVEVQENVRGEDMFVIQSTSAARGSRPCSICAAGPPGGFGFITSPVIGCFTSPPGACQMNSASPEMGSEMP